MFGKNGLPQHRALKHGVGKPALTPGRRGNPAAEHDGSRAAPLAPEAKGAASELAAPAASSPTEPKPERGFLGWIADNLP